MTSVQIDLPEGSSLAGMTLAGSPPVLTAMDPDAASLTTTSGSTVPLYWYAQTLSVPKIEYSYIEDAHTLQELLKKFSDAPRTLTLFKTPLIGPPQITLSLPKGKDIGLDLDGFPPVVTHVETSSIWSGGIVPEGFVVDRVILNNDQELSLESGGFTANNVNRALAESSNEEGRIMILKKVKPKGDVTSSSRPIDWSSFTNESKWTIKRMFGLETKPCAVRKSAVKSLD